MRFDNTFNGVYSIATGTSFEWMNTTEVLRLGVVIFETDTNKVKITDGVHAYSDLPHVPLSNDLSPTVLSYLQNAKQEGGVVATEDDGVISSDAIPIHLKTSVLVIVSTIAERDTLTPDEYANKLIYVTDASSDPTVMSGAAAYINNNSTWIKWTSEESVDLSTSDYISKPHATLDIVSDSAGYVKMASAERSTLSSLVNTTLVDRPDKVYLIQPLPASAFTD